MWGDESGNGVALDVTMKEAYSSGVGATGLTAGPPALRSAQSLSTLRDFPMTYAPLVHMPSTQMASANMMRSHVYNTVTQLNTAHTNYYVMNNNQFLSDAASSTHRGLDQVAAEMQELLPALLSRRAIAAPGKLLRASPVVVEAITDPNRRAPGGTCGPSGDKVCIEELSAGIWEEEVANGADGQPLGSPYFCARVVVVNSQDRPVPARVRIAGLPTEAAAAGSGGGIVQASRMFTAVYTLNLTRTTSGDWLLEDYLDGASTNIYSIGCEVPAQAAENLVVNGNFEDVMHSHPTSLLQQDHRNGGWHVFAGDTVGCKETPCVLCKGLYCPAMMLSSENRTDDRAKITADCADPYEGRYSGRIVVPTARPVQLGIAIAVDPKKPFAAGDKLSVSFVARSSPAGANVSVASGMIGGDAASTGALGGDTLGVGWSRHGPYEITLIMPGFNSSLLGAFVENAPLHMIVATPYRTATVVHVDAVVVTRVATEVAGDGK